jgi:hypothetical protein
MHKTLKFTRTQPPMWRMADATDLVPTAQWAVFMSKFFYVGSAVTVVIGIIALLTLSGANRRYIAQLPRWQRLLFWPW